MGRAIDLENRIDKLEHRVNEILLILDELSRTNTTKENIDIHEATKEEKTNDEGNGKRNIKSDSGKSKKSGGDNNTKTGSK